MTPEKLRNTLRQETASARDFLALLQREYTALAERDADDIEDITRQKQALAHRLDECGRERDRITTLAGYEPGTKGLQRLLSHYNDPELTAIARQLAELALQCREKNLAVGLLIGKGLAYTQQARDILKNGGQPTGAAYSASGKSVATALSNTLARA